MNAWTVRLRADQSGHSGPASLSPNPSEFVIEESLGYLVNRVARSMSRQLAEALEPAGIGIGQWSVLLVLWAHDGLSQAELSRLVAIEPPTLVRTIDRMVRSGLVRRALDGSDRRINRIHLTERGHLLADQLIPRAVEVNAVNLGRMSAREGRMLRRLLAKLLVPGG